MTSYREYSRDLTPKQIDGLKTRYSEHLKLARGGFLTDKQRKRLLRIKKKERETPDSDFWWRIKESIRSSMIDMKLVCDVASEKELQEIFGTKLTGKEFGDTYPLNAVLSSLLPSTVSVAILRESIDQIRKNIRSAKIDKINRKDIKGEPERLQDWLNNWEPRLKEQEQKLDEEIEKLAKQEWRKFILEDLVLQCLTWYTNSGVFKTDSHRRLLDDAIDAITVMGSGNKKFWRYDESHYGAMTEL